MRIGLLITVLFSSALYAEVPSEWNRYCDADSKVAQKSSATPRPNYNNSLIEKVAFKLTAIENKELEGRRKDKKLEVDRRSKKEYIRSVSFYPYSDMENTYGLCSSKDFQLGRCKTQQLPPQKVGIQTHNMLTILCGEYRDRLTTLRAKLKWLSGTNIVSNNNQSYNPKKKVFDQLTGEGYKKMVELSYNLHSFRTEVLGPLSDAELEITQKSVAPMSVCEYEFLLSEYLSKSKGIETRTDFEVYETKRKVFEKTCRKKDLRDVYEFRGDGNLKAQSTESNGNIWFARAFTKACDEHMQVKAKGKTRGNMTSDDCKKYFKTPFKSRQNLNQEAFLRMFYYPKEAQGLDILTIMRRFDAEDPRGTVFITEDINNDGIGELIVLDPKVVATCTDEVAFDSPGACQILWARSVIANRDAHDWATMQEADDTIFTLLVLAGKKQLSENKQYLPVIEKAQKVADSWYEGDTNYLEGIHFISEVDPRWQKSYARSKDRGFTRVFKDKQEAWERMTIALDRHTDWYSIDTLHIKNGYYQSTFSPFVASSYYLYNSHTFTLPGYAMNIDLDPGRMHWMFVQRVSRDKWFNAERLNRNWPLPVKEFDMMNLWFDEMTFSRSGLGMSENGWDRFGSPAENELESVLWLYEVPRFEFKH